jgi:MFS family permease
VKFGKRPVFLAANLILLVSSVWAIYATSWKALLFSRLLGSIGEVPYQALVGAIVPDLYDLFIMFTENELFHPSERPTFSGLDRGSPR